MNQRETVPEGFVEEIQDFVLRFEAMRAAAHARERDGFAELTSEYGCYRIAAAEADDFNGYTVAVKDTAGGEWVEEYTIPGEAVVTAVREYKELLGAHRAMETKLATDLAAVVEELREEGGFDLADAVVRLADILVSVPRVRTVTCDAPAETVVFDDGTEATDGVAVYIPEEYW